MDENVSRMRSLFRAYRAQNPLPSKNTIGSSILNALLSDMPEKESTIINLFGLKLDEVYSLGWHGSLEDRKTAPILSNNSQLAQAMYIELFGKSGLDEATWSDIMRFLSVAVMELLRALATDEYAKKCDAQRETRHRLADTPEPFGKHRPVTWEIACYYPKYALRRLEAIDSIDDEDTKAAVMLREMLGMSSQDIATILCRTDEVAFLLVDTELVIEQRINTTYQASIFSE